MSAGERAGRSGRPGRAGLSQPAAMVASSVILAVTGYATQALLSRILAPADYGGFTFVLAASTATAVVLTSGVPLAASRRIAADPARAAATERAARRAQVALTLAVLGGFLAASHAWMLARGRLDLQAAFLASTALLATYSWAGYQWNVLVGHRRFVPQAATSVAGSIAKVAAALGLAAAGLGVVGALAGYALAAAVQAALAWLVHRAVPHGAADGGEPAEATAAVRPAELRREAAHGLALSVGLAFLPALDLLVAGTLLAEGEVGLYGAASTAARLVGLLVGGLALYLFPMAARPAGEPALRAALAVAPALLLGAALGLYAIRAPFLRLAFGAEYEGGAPILAVLAWAGSAAAAIALYANLLYARGAARWTTLSLAATAAVTVAAGAALVPALGRLGPPVGAAAAGLTGLGLLLAGAHRQGLHPVRGPWLRAGAATALAAAAVLAVERQAPGAAPVAGAVLATALAGGLVAVELGLERRAQGASA